MAKFDALHLDEDLIKRLPLPLAQVCRRAQNAKSALERHQAAFYCWEISLKLLASAAIVEYAELKDDDAQLAERLRNLARPSLGHWWEFLRRLTPILADRQDAGFRSIRDLLFSRARDDLPRCCGLDAALRGVLDKQAGARSTVRLSDLLDRLVHYRNLELGHGASGQKPASFYEDMTGALLAALGELLQRLDVLAGRKLVFVADVRRQSSGAWLIERLELAGESARRIESFELPASATLDLPRPELVYLERRPASAAGPPLALPMDPLVLFQAESGEVLFLNSQKGKKNAEFLCYHTGAVIRRDLVGGDRRELFSKIFGSAFQDEAIAAWSANSLAEEGPPEEVPTPARTIGEFELLSKIDQGGMGVVYRAWQPSLGRPVALKALLRFGDPKSEARFAREIRALGRVEHPNVVKIFTSGSAGDQWFYAMELVDGANLASICAQLAQESRGDVGAEDWRYAASTACERARSAEQLLSGESPPPKPTPVSAPSEDVPAELGSLRGNRSHVSLVSEIMRQVALAAHALHEAGVIHRDIKPGNIMLTMDGERAVLMDLGLAQLSDDAEGRLNRTRQFVGTLRYASPEQLLAACVDRRTDVYSLGATLWEVLTLRPLFDATESTPSPELMQRIQTRMPERPRKINPHIPQDLETIVLKCLQKDPHARYGTALELAEDLERFLGGEPVRAQPPTIRYVLTKYVHKHRMRIAVMAAGMLLLVLAAVGAFVKISTERDRAETALAGEAEAHRQVDELLDHEKQSNQKLRQQQRDLQHLLAENYLQSGATDCVNHEPGLGLSSLLAAYEAADPDDPLRRSIRLLMAGWERGLATRFLSEENIEAVGFQPGGRLVVTAGRDGSARFWDKYTRLPSGKPVTPGGKIWSAVFSPKGDWLATGDDERGAILWDVQTRKMRGDPMIHPRPARVRALAFSPDGKILATGCGDSLLRLADVVPQKPMGDARLWDVATQQPIGAPMPHGKEVLCVAFSPDGSTLATGCDDKLLRFWDVKTQKPIREPIPHPNGVWTVSFSPDGKYFFTGDWGDKTNGGVGRLYDAATHKLVHDRIQHKKGILASVFTADSQQVFVGSRDATAQFWDVAKGIRVGQDYASLRSIPSVAISPDGPPWQTDPAKPHATEFMTCSRDNVARLFRDSEPRPAGPTFAHSRAVTALAIAPDGARLATACKDGSARLWDISTGNRIGKDMKHDGPVNAVAFSMDGSLLVSAGEDKTIRQWRTADGEPAADPIHYRGAITSLALFPDRPWALVGGRADRAAQCIDLTTGKLIQEPLRHDEAVRAVALASAGKLLITGSEDSSLHLWDRDTHLPVGKKMGHGDRILALAADRSGKLLASGGADNTVRLWNLADQRLLQDMKGHEHDVYAVAVSPDASIILSGGGPDDRTSRLWDAATGKQAADAIKHESAVLAVAFLPDGMRYAVARASGKVDLWATPQPVPDEPRRIAAWIRSRTLWTREGANHRRLTAAEWIESIQTLADLGGPFPTSDGP